MTDRAYNEDEALMGYVFTNHPEIIGPRQCVPTDEEVIAQLPVDLQEEYREHCREVHGILRKSREREAQLSNDNQVIEVLPQLPELRSELLHRVDSIRRRLAKEAFRQVFRERGSGARIARCEKCQKILMTPRARQCLWCGHDWHERADR